jgi:hypothetical protein
VILSINEPSDSLVKLPSEAPKNLKLLIINALDSSELRSLPSQNIHFAW